jgi:dolichyl-phosphate-mannose-protein mannosyltransferase
VTQTSVRPDGAGSASTSASASAPPPGGKPDGARWISRPTEAFTTEALIQRLLGGIRSWRDYPPSLRLWFWLVPALTAAVGGVLRFVRLDAPRSLVFDETYYVKDAYSLLVSGYERNWPD